MHVYTALCLFLPISKLLYRYICEPWMKGMSPLLAEHEAIHVINDVETRAEPCSTAQYAPKYLSFVYFL